jgi:hypothetical protein
MFFRPCTLTPSPPNSTHKYLVVTRLLYLVHYTCYIRIGMLSVLIIRVDTLPRYSKMAARFLIYITWHVLTLNSCYGNMEFLNYNDKF